MCLFSGHMKKDKEHKWFSSKSQSMSKTIMMILFIFMVLFLSLMIAFSHLKAKENEQQLKAELSFVYASSEEVVEDYPAQLIRGDDSLITHAEFDRALSINHDYWIKIEIAENLDFSSSPIIYFNYSNFNTLMIYYKNIENTILSLEPERKLSLYPYFKVPIDHSPGTPIIVKINHVIPFYEVIMTNEYNYFKKLNTLSFLLMFSYGIIFAFILFNLVLGYYTKKKYFLFHALYLFSVFLYDFHSNGLLYVMTQKFYPNYYYLAFLTFLSILIFVYQYLDVRQNMPRLKKIFTGAMGVNFVMIIISIMGYGDQLFVVGLGMAVLLPIVIAVAMINCYKNKRHISNYFVFGVFILGLGEFLYILLQVGLVPKNLFTQYGFTFALTVEATLFTLSILDRINELKAYSYKYYNIANTDKLTGLYNRHYLDDHVEEAQELSKRYELPLSIVMFDIDHFKRINDNYGHDVGDTVLQKLARRVKKATRKNDILVRWGGEEFVIVMLKSDIHHALTHAEKIRQLVENKNIHEDIAITISLGVAQWLHEETIDETFKRADQGLYMSKASGRNTISAVYEKNDVLLRGIKWSHVFESGHPIIDSEHKELLVLANNLLDIHLDKSLFIEKLKHLVNEIIQHFESEESILEAVEYEALMSHRQVHEEIKLLIHDLIERFIQNEISSEDVVVKILQTYIVGHLITEDSKFFDRVSKKHTLNHLIE